MAEDWVQGFTDAMRRLEDQSDVGPLMEQFAPNAELWSMVRKEAFRGPEAIRGFWEQYRGQFRDLHAEVQRAVVSGSEAALEWRATGHLTQSDAEVHYWGVTLLSRGDQGIQRCASYYDPKPLMEAAGKATAESQPAQVPSALTTPRTAAEGASVRAPNPEEEPATGQKPSAGETGATGEQPPPAEPSTSEGAPGPEEETESLPSYG